jgi:predicted DNA-binding protein YlxM (UPF0122 family)
MRFKPLTQEQQEIFKKLYLEGYSASMIYEKLGYPYKPEYQQRYSALLRAYRIRLGLPMRGFRVKPKFYRVPQPKITDEMERKHRIKQLEKMIPKWENRVALWKQELASFSVNKTIKNQGDLK